MAIKHGDPSFTDGTTGQPGQFSLIFHGLDHGTFVMPIPPDALNIVYPERLAVTQTRGGMYVDDWGEGLITVVIQGSFGWGIQSGTGQTGHEYFAALVHLWETRTQAVKNNDPNDYLVKFTNKQDNIVYECVVPDFRYNRDRNSPLVCRYQMTLQVVRVLNIFGANPNGANIDHPTFAPDALDAQFDQVAASRAAITEAQTTANELAGVLNLQDYRTNLLDFIYTTSQPQTLTQITRSVFNIPSATPTAQDTTNSLATHRDAVAPYVAALQASNLIQRSDPNRAAGLSFVRVPDINTLVNVPFDGNWIVQ